MGQPLTKLSFEEWVAHVFDHAAMGPQWYWDPQAPYWDGAPPVTVDYLTRLFASADTLLEWYADAQIDQGFWYLAGGCTAFSELMDGRVSDEARIRCVEAVIPLYEKLFAPRCKAQLVHTMPRDRRAHPVNMTCYVFWEHWPTWGSPQSPQWRTFDEACLDVMARVLKLDSLACQESALHGLGHWSRSYPHFVQRTIDEYVAACADLDEGLREYAMAARGGCVA